MSSNNNKLVLVTGGSRGIGYATSRLLCARGYDVAINYHTDRESALQLLDCIQSQNTETSLKTADASVIQRGQAMIFQADVSKEDEVKALFQSIFEYFGRNPDGLVNNAGIVGERVPNNDITLMKSEDLQRVFAVNTYGPFYCSREFVNCVSIQKEGGTGGVIVNVSSGAAYLGTTNLIYCMSKGALDSMMIGLSQSLPKLHGIRINSVVPGMTETDMSTAEQRDAKKHLVPMGRPGTPEEVAEGILFLLSDESRYCSGAKIRIAGGRP